MLSGCRTAHATPRGFTLIELICVLMLFGMIGMMVFSGFFAGIREYTVIRQISHDADVLTLARVRLYKELRATTRILTCTAHRLEFQIPDGSIRELTLDADELLLEGQPLLRGISGNFSRPKSPDGTDDLTGIIISLERNGIPCQLELHPTMLLP